MSARQSTSGEEVPWPSPAANPHLVGHVRAERQFLEALRRGRLHHAWLLTGPKGVGKATLAYRMARQVLARGSAGQGEAALTDNDSLYMPPSHPVFRKVAAGGHPDMKVLSRREDPRTGRPRAQIGVEDAREVLRFAAMTTAAGGWRVVLIDAADDLNAAAANALLKTLEEPPPATLFLLLSHAPGRLLPTIRSRCLHLPLSPLSEAQVREALSLIMPREGLAEDRLTAAISLAGGSPGRALALAGTRVGELFHRLLDTLSAGAGCDRGRLLEIARELAAPAALADWQLFGEVLLDWLRRRAGELARHGHADAAHATAVAEADIRATLEETERLNLDRGLALMEAFSRLRGLPSLALPT